MHTDPDRRSPAVPSSTRGSRRIPLLLILGFLLGGAAIWASGDVYGAIFRAYTATPAGTYSDLSQRWLGTRVALLERGDPYSPTIGPRIQELFYGRVLTAGEPHRPTDPQAFSYPLYLIWLLWPLALLPFALASALFKVLALALLTGSTYLYCRLIGWPGARWGRAALAAGILLTPGGLGAVRGDQLSVLVYALLLAVPACLAGHRFVLAGVLLALAWIKPQLALPLTLGLGVWFVARSGGKRALGAAAMTGAALLIASELVLPGWWREWLGSLEGYASATTGFQGFAGYRMLDWLGVALRAGLLLGILAIWLRIRRAPVTPWPFGFVVAATLPLTIAIQQPWYTYNLVFLYPAALLLLAGLRGALAPAPPPPRALGTLALALFALPWVVYPLLYGAYLLGLLPTSTAGPK